MIIFPTWRSNGDAVLGRAIGTVTATGTHVVAIPVEVGPQDARRVAALRSEEIEAFVGMLDGAGADTHLWRHETDLVDVLAPERSPVERAVVG